MAEQDLNRASPRMFGLVVVLGLLAAIAIGACAGATDADADPDTPRALPVYSTAAPVLTVGVLSGETEFEFQAIQDVVRLSDGRIVLSDSGDQQLHFFSAEGAPLGTAGGSGGGPGEFRQISSVYRLPGDTLMVLDAGRARVAWFDGAGDFISDKPSSEVWAEELFTMDTWPVRRFLVQGARSSQVRAEVEATIRRLPLPYGQSLIRYAQVADNADIWIREEWSGNHAPTRWLVVSPAGEPLHWVDLPAGFHPQTISGNEVLGRAIGDFDVETVAVYALNRTDATSPEPAWIFSPMQIPDSTAVDPEELMATVRGSIKFMASAQEIHYAMNGAYTATLDSLKIDNEEFPEELEVQLLFGTSRGWAMLGALPNADRICTLGYGSGVPAGWVGGRVTCGNQP